jgi:hypothetical protein
MVYPASPRSGMDARYPSRVPGVATGTSGNTCGEFISSGGVPGIGIPPRGARDAM